MKLFTFLDEAAGIELTLPVTPSGYSWREGRRVETVELQESGEANLAGVMAMGSATLSVMLPSQLYPFCAPGASAEPGRYLRQLRAWMEAGTAVRFMVSGTGLNVPVLIEEISSGEQDGTGDIYASISLQQWRRLEAPAMAIASVGTQSARKRDAATGAAEEKSYTVKAGDCLWAIAQQFYGDGSLYKRLAAANSGVIRNGNLIYPGDVLKIPPLDALPAAKADSPSQKIGTATATRYNDKTGKWELIPSLASIREVTDGDVYWK
ncbi:MAG: LysM peptidoglycan-binding domain-containing protein [Candidatus Heteroscillospira sp.]|jgi:LysM repeat protein